MSQKVTDAFGEILHQGDSIAWLGSPSGYKHMKKGTLLEIDESNYFPALKVRGEGRCRNSILVACYRNYQYKDTFTFNRVVKL